jgi:hypothetical protein
VINTYTWLDVDRELKKCSAWAKANIKGSKGPTRRRIIAWMNRADGKPVDTRYKKDAGGELPPVLEPESWREVILREAAENSIYQQIVRDNTPWAEISRGSQLDIVRFVEANK